MYSPQIYPPDTASPLSLLLFSVKCRARRACSGVAMLFATFCFFCCPSVQAQTQCSGQNLSLADYDSTVHQRLDTQLLNMFGNYCGEANGAEQIAFGTTTGNLPCNISITQEGNFTFHVGDKTVFWKQTQVMFTMTGDDENKHYYLWGGNADISAIFDIQDKRLARVRTVTKSATNPDEHTYRSCDFHFVSTAVGDPERTHFASANSLPRATVGSFSGQNNNLSNSCRLTVSPNGQVDLRFQIDGETLRSTGELRGRFYDQVSYGTAVTTVSNSDSWNTDKEVVYGPKVSYAESGEPIRASVRIGENDYLCPLSDGVGGAPSCSGDSCYPKTKGVGEASCVASVGNPVNVVSGNKFQTEVDYAGGGSNPIRFERYYNSHISVATASMGTGWRTNLDWTLSLTSDKTFAFLVKPNGQAVLFEKGGTAWLATNEKAYSMRAATSSDPAGSAWIVVNQKRESIIFDSMGNLKGIRDDSGQDLLVTRDELNRVKTLAGQPGRALAFTYDGQSRVQTMRDPAGVLFTYRYDADRLARVERSYDNKVVAREYKYENEHFPAALTGIVDENGARFATWHYDQFGRAYSSEHANGVDRYTIAFGENSSVVTDPIGAIRTYTLATVGEGTQVAGLDQPAGSGCPAAFSAASYDDDGNVKSSTNFNGVVTNYTYDIPRQLITVKTEAAGTSEQRTTTTEWHPAYRIPKRIAEPKRLTTFDYFADGKLKTRSVQATRDETGAQAFTAILTGPVSTWSYSYNAQGKIETITGPRAGGVDKTTFAYDLVTGDLLSIKNALGHTTRFGDYDANGRARLITEPNNTTTRVSYTDRGMPETISVSDGKRTLITRSAYDNVGQLKRVTLPDGSYLAYAYDDAHRLTDVFDSAGNSIHYVLNNLGAREREEVKDVSGTLKRRVLREFDSLNRVKSTTGGAL